jgi:type II secretory pathway pseudopilin PulG
MVMKPKTHSSGFTLAEALVATSLFTLVMAMLIDSFLICNRNWYRARVHMMATQRGSQCLESMVYGVGTGLGLRAAYRTTNTGTAASWSLMNSNYYGVDWYRYVPDSKIVIYSNGTMNCRIATNVISSWVSNVPAGLAISVTICETDGKFTDTNSMRTTIKWRTPRSY